MENLDEAIVVTQFYNNLSFEDFVILFEEAKNIKVPSEKISEWKYIGLNNVDFYKMHEEFLKE